MNEEATKASEDGMPVINTDVIDKCLSLCSENDLSGVSIRCLVFADTGLVFL